MWSKKKEDAPASPEKPAFVPSTPAVEPQRKETNSMSSPNRSFESEPLTPRGSVGSAALGKNVTVKGQIFAREDLTIDGEVEGTVECHEHRLTIGPNARVQAGLKAREIIIQGSIQGMSMRPIRSILKRKRSWSVISRPAASSSKMARISRAASIFRSPTRGKPQTRRGLRIESAQQPLSTAKPTPVASSAGAPVR